MRQPETPDATNQPESDTKELLEWHDLQNAQIDSMLEVWDNPEDEIWNHTSVADGRQRVPCRHA